jgi:hypothetical protein
MISPECQLFGEKVMRQFNSSARETDAKPDAGPLYRLSRTFGGTPAEKQL